MRDDEFLFDGVNSRDMGIVVRHINKPVAPEVSNARVPIPARYGDVNQGNAYGAKTWTIEVQFLAETNQDYNDEIHRLADYLIRPNDNGKEYEMIFGDEPDVTYYGSFTAIPEAAQIQDLVNDSQLSLTFMASDPQGYGKQIEVPVTSEPFDFKPKGTGLIYPVYTLIPKHDIYELGVGFDQNMTDGYIAAGYSIDASEAGSIADNNPVLVDDPCNTMATWIEKTGTPTYLDGVVDTAGAVESRVNSIAIKKLDDGAKYDYGDVTAHTNEWFGKLIEHEALPTAVSDFDMTFRIHHVKKYGRAISKSEVYLLDERGKAVGVVNMADAPKGAMTTFSMKFGTGMTKVVADKIHYGPLVNNANTRTKVKIASQSVALTDYHNSNYFNEGFIQINMHKVGLTVNVTVQECSMDTGGYDSTIVNNRQYTLTEDEDFNLNTIAWYGAAFPIEEDKGKNGKPSKDYNHGFNSITGYHVDKIIDPDQTTAQVIAHAGSMILVDSQDKSVTVVDGGGTRSLNDVISLGSTFPPVKGGKTTALAFSPSVLDGDVSITYRPAYL